MSNAAHSRLMEERGKSMYGGEESTAKAGLTHVNMKVYCRRMGGSIN